MCRGELGGAPGSGWRVRAPSNQADKRWDGSTPLVPHMPPKTRPLVPLTDRGLVLLYK